MFIRELQPDIAESVVMLVQTHFRTILADSKLEGTFLSCLEKQQQKMCIYNETNDTLLCLL